MRFVLRATVFCLIVFGLSSCDEAGDPPLVRQVEESGNISVMELDVVYGLRRRVVPLRFYLPAEPGAHPTVLFSHGLGGSNRGNRYLGEHWARAGYVAVFMQHIGSDESVWQDLPRSERLAALKGATSALNTLNRFRDVPAVIDALVDWNEAEGSELEGRMDLTRLGMAGHSYGAVTTQAVSGQTQRGRARFTDDRIKAALILSPGAPQRGDSRDHFGAVNIPWMLMTGTKDVAMVGPQDVASRLAVYPALPKGNKFELVLEDGEHHAFSDGAGLGKKRNPNHHPVILALSTAFWDAYLREDDVAETWLKGDAVAELLEPGDRWQRK